MNEERQSKRSEEWDRVTDRLREARDIKDKRGLMDELLGHSLKGEMAPSDMTDIQLVMLQSSLLSLMDMHKEGALLPLFAREIHEAGVTMRQLNDELLRLILTVLVEIHGEMVNRPGVMKDILGDREKAWKVVRGIHTNWLGIKG